MVQFSVAWYLVVLLQWVRISIDLRTFFETSSLCTKDVLGVQVIDSRGVFSGYVGENSKAFC